MKQEEYDKLLVESFYLRPDYCMWRIIGVRMEDRTQEITPLMRIPHDHCYGMTVAAFVASYLPKLADILWRRSKKDIDLISKVLSKSKIDTEKNNVQGATMKFRTNQNTKEIKRYSKIMKLKADISDINDRAGNHHWSVCK